jgi:predicted dehydrogenase
MKTPMRTKYAIVGSGGRSRMFYNAILGPHQNASALVALCDTNQTRCSSLGQATPMARIRRIGLSTTLKTMHS